MAFLDVIMVFIRDVLDSLFSSSSPEVKKKHQLKQLATNPSGVQSSYIQARRSPSKHPFLQPYIKFINTCSQ